jgi:hypothetical protein
MPAFRWDSRHLPCQYLILFLAPPLTLLAPPRTPFTSRSRIFFPDFFVLFPFFFPATCHSFLSLVLRVLATHSPGLDATF